jgi:hypothetical protein
VSGELEAARKEQDPARRIERFTQIYGPSRQMFESLKSQLDRIPTEAQKQAAAQAAATRPAGRVRLPASRPAASSRPAATSQPARN